MPLFSFAFTACVVTSVSPSAATHAGTTAGETTGSTTGAGGAAGVAGTALPLKTGVGSPRRIRATYQAAPPPSTSTLSQRRPRSMGATLRHRAGSANGPPSRGDRHRPADPPTDRRARHRGHHARLPGSGVPALPPAAPVALHPGRRRVVGPPWCAGALGRRRG